MEMYSYKMWFKDGDSYLPLYDFSVLTNIKTLQLGLMNADLTVKEVFDFCLKFKFQKFLFYIPNLNQEKEKCQIIT